MNIVCVIKKVQTHVFKQYAFIHMSIDNAHWVNIHTESTQIIAEKQKQAQQFIYMYYWSKLFVLHKYQCVKCCYIDWFTSIVISGLETAILTTDTLQLLAS